MTARTETARSPVVAAAALAACLAGCSDPSFETAGGSEPIAREAEGLLEFFPQFNVNVSTCFRQTTSSRPTLHADALAVFDRLQESWATAARINFGPTVNKVDRFETGCADTSGRMRITLVDANVAVSSTSGQVQVMGGLLSSGHHAAHEVGHGLGHVHENRRTDFVAPADWITAADCGIGGTTPNTNTAADVNSVMVPNQCRPNPRPVSFWDAVGAQERHGRRVFSIFPLVSWSKNGIRATADSASAASRFKPDGHKPAFPEGWIWQDLMPGTGWVFLYKHPTTLSYVIAASSTTMSELQAAGYTGLGAIGAIYKEQGFSTCLQPLNTYKLSSVSPPRYATLANPDAQAKAQSDGYVFWRTEGYVFTHSPFSEQGYAQPNAYPYHLLSKYVLTQGSTKQDLALVTVGHAAINDLNARGYKFVNFNGAVLKCRMPDTTPLNLYYSSSRAEYFTSTDLFPPSGYTLQGTLGYVFTSAVAPATTPLAVTRYSGSAGFWDFNTSARYPNPAGQTLIGSYSATTTPSMHALEITSAGYGL